jgi:hypothetical protein
MKVTLSTNSVVWSITLSFSFDPLLLQLPRVPLLFSVES